MARSAPPVELHNPMEGMPDAWQSHETIADFIQRLPPSTTTVGTVGPWIWVANPHRSSQPDRKGTDINELTRRGSELLQESRQTRQRLQIENRAAGHAAVTRAMNQEAESLKLRIAELAERTNVLTGKWMLFPSLQDVDRVWRIVAQAVIDNRLGPSAKVATDNGTGAARLICVYTKDFRDTDDILRVLKELIVMDLVEGSSTRGIYYKSDAYTYLDIYGPTASEFGLQASLHSSRKLLASADTTQPKNIPQKKQTTLDAFRRG